MTPDGSSNLQAPVRRRAGGAGAGLSLAVPGHPSSLLLLWLSIAAVLLVVARNNVFAGPTYEWADFAANALQIDRAKHLSELLGNYSRFGFHHPGPAFFYVYAAGEALFFDALHVVAAPANAHLLASIILQAAFMAVSLTALSRALPAVHRGSFLLAAGSLAILLFALAQQPELNIWPPYVLVWPFLAFLSCAIAVAAGHSAYLVAGAIAGVFLVHGHVAQPFFVVPISAVAYLSLLRHGSSSRHVAWHHVAAALVVAIGLLPIVLDALTAATPNVVRILEAPRGAARSPSEGLAYTLGFLEFPTWLSPPLSLGLRAVLSRIWPQALLLGLAIAWPARSLLRSGRPGRLEGFSGALSPWAAFSVVLVLATLLAYGWSMLQFGAPWAFNSFFVFGLLFLALVPLALVLSTRIPRVMPFALAAGVVAMLVAPAPATLFRQSIGDEIHDRVQQLLLTSPPSTPVVVESDDWGLVLPVVLQLERAGVVSLVPPRFRLMAGDARVYPSPAWPSGMRHLTLIVTATPALSLQLGQPT